MASIQYKIGGKFDPSAVTACKTGFKSLDNITKSFGIKANSNIGQFLKGLSSIAPQILAIGATIGTISKLAKSIHECTNMFAEAELGSIRLGSAIANSTKLGTDSFEKLNKKATEFSKISIYSADDITAMQAYLAGLNLTEEQINKTIEASMNLSAYNGNDLRTSVETLSKTFTGTEGKLKNLGTEFSDLSDEELKSGKAIDLVNEKYKNFSSTIANNTLSGKRLQIKNTVNDIKQVVGKLFGDMEFKVLVNVQPMLENFKTGLENFNNTLLNFFSNIPALAEISAQAVFDIFTNLLLPSTWISLLQSTLNTFYNLSVDIWIGISNIVASIFKLIFDNLKTAIKNIGIILKSVFIDAINLLINGVNKVTSAINNSGLAKVLNIKIGTIQTLEAPEKINGADIFKTFANDVGNIVKQYTGMIKNEMTDTKKFAVEVLHTVVSPAKDSIEKMKNILSTKPISANKVEINSKTNENKREIEPYSKSELDKGNKIASQSNKSNAEKKENPFASLKDSFGELGTAIQSLMAGNVIGVIAQAVSSLVSAFTSIENVNKSLNFLSTICNSMRIVIEPLVNDCFAPFVILFEDIGTVIGTLLLPAFELIKSIITPIMNVVITLMNVLMPIITTVSQLLNIMISLSPILNILTVAFNFLGNLITLIYNKILVPVVNGCIWIFTKCSNFIIGIWNKMIEVLKSIDILGWKPFDGLSSKAEINYDDMALKEVSATTDSTTSNTVSTSSGSASYTASRDIIQNFYISDSYVCGDAQKIALAIRAEIRNAEKLGY